MWHAILAFLAGLIPSVPADHCPYHRMWASGDNAAGPVMVASASPYIPCSFAANGHFAGLDSHGASRDRANG